MPNFSDTIFGFLDENYPSSSSDSSGSSPSSGWDGLGRAGADRNIGRCQNDQDGDDDDNKVGKNPEEFKAFWDEQEQLLLAALSRTSSTESKIAKATNDALGKLKSTDHPNRQCQCRTSPAKPTPESVAVDVDGPCRRCLRVWVADYLQNTACNSSSNNNTIITCSIRKSNMKSSPEIPASKHTFIEFTVEENPSSSSKNNNRTTTTRKRRVIVVELSFRAEFEMARASDEYARLVACLPEVFVGKPERLKAVVKIMCAAAKKCAKDKNVHLAPWRKQSYMLSKWMLTSAATAAGTTPSPPSAANAGKGVGPGRLFEKSTADGETGKKEVRSGKPRASLLTFALIDALERPHRGPQVVAVK